MTLIDYLILFPNPVSEEAHVRFVLNDTKDFALRIYDASGRILFIGEDQTLAPAEHDIVLPVRDFDPGIYLVQVRIGQKYIYREMMVQ